MARKSTRLRNILGMRYVTGPLFEDYPNCLEREPYQWVVKSALTDPAKMYSVGDIVNFCKVCGGSSSRSEFAEHLHEHVDDLALSRAALLKKYADAKRGIRAEPEQEQLPLYDDVKAIIAGTMESWDDDGLPEFNVFWGELSSTLASAIVGDVSGEDVEYALCQNCQ